MSKPKPEDVMRGLKHCHVSGCTDCPYYENPKCDTALYKDALALLRKNDALNAELTQTIAEKTALIEELQLGWSEDQERVRKILDEKDAEIDKLIKERDEARRDVGVAERNHHKSAEELERLTKAFLVSLEVAEDAYDDGRSEAITEFAEKLSKAHKVYVDRNDCMVLAVDVDTILKIAKEMKEE